MKYSYLILALMLSGCMATVEPSTYRTEADVDVYTSSSVPVMVAARITYPRRAYRSHVPYWGTYPSRRRLRRWPSYVCSKYDPDCRRMERRSPIYITYRNKPIMVNKLKPPKTKKPLAAKKANPKKRKRKLKKKKSHKNR
jgi:hypothetical protein